MLVRRLRICRPGYEGVRSLKKSKNRKKWFIIISAVLLLVIVVGLSSAWPLLWMEPAATGQVMDTDIIAAQVHSNSLYFLGTSDGYIVVDAGSDVENTKKVMAEVGIDPLAVKYVLMTHSDYDHVAALALFTNAKIYMSEDELQMVNGTTKRNLAGFSSLPDGVSQDALILLQDRQELTIGGHRIFCIQAPGHTPGSMAYQLDDTYLFTGDAFRVSGGTIGIHPYTMDKETAGASIQKLRENMQGCALVLTAHYGYYPCDTLK